MRAMKSWKQRIVKAAWSFALCAGLPLAAAPDGTNPYLPIVDRNTFGLKDPPPPAPPPPPEAPPSAPANVVKLTGITSILSKNKALIEITEPGNPKVIKPIMAVGDPPQNGVELLAIDVEKNQVLIRNGGVETNLTFEAVTLSSKTPAAPVATLPGRVNPRFVNPTAAAAAAAAGAPNPGATATVVGNTRRSSASGRNNITVAGAEPTSMAAYASGANIPAIPNTANPRTIPTTRPLRTPTQPNAPAMTREEAIIRLELQREINNAVMPDAPPLPPTPITPAPTGYETDPQD